MLIVMGARLSDINKSCLTEFRKHWECLDNNNQQLWHCRRPEKTLNACVFEKLVGPSAERPFEGTLVDIDIEIGEDNPWDTSWGNSCALEKAANILSESLIFYFWC